MAFFATMALFPFTGLLAIHNTHLNTKLSSSPLQYFWLASVLMFVVIFWDNIVQKLQSLVDVQRVLMFLLLEQKFGRSSVEEKGKDEEPSSQDCLDTKKGDVNVHREEAEIVMRSLGFVYGQESGEEMKEWIDCKEVSRLFEEEEPSLEEVREAFEVFDENKDGFIDAQELQRVLCLLGLKEGHELENCRRMIKHFDQNGDDRIDLCEFTRFLETSFV